EQPHGRVSGLRHPAKAGGRPTRQGHHDRRPAGHQARHCRHAGRQAGARQCTEFGLCPGQCLHQIANSPLNTGLPMDMTPHFPIYMDYGATTPVDPRVVDAMIPWLREHFGNPASRSHAWGWEAEEAVETARGHVAALVGADPREIVWTSGATESNNLALKGAANFYKEKGKHLITVKTEHKAVLDTMRELERQGYEVTYLDVQEDGLLDLDVLKAAMRPDTIL